MLVVINKKLCWKAAFSGPSFPCSVTCPLFHSDLVSSLTKTIFCCQKNMVSATFSSNPGLSRSYTSKEKTSATPGCRQCFLFSLSLRAIHSSVQWVQPSAPGGSEAVENRFWAQAVILCSESNQKKILPCDFNLKIKVSASLKFCYLLQSWRQLNKINSLRIQPDAL